MEPFFWVWKRIHQDGRYLRHDWVVKVDTDTAFLPSLLHDWLVGRRAPEQGAYLSTRGDCGGTSSSLSGVMDVFSRTAIERYVQDIERCKGAYASDMGDWGEDLFVQKCMDSAGVQCWGQDTDTLVCDYSHGCMRTCGHGKAVAFYPHTDVDTIRHCGLAVKST